ncbi:hypothetical protein E2562_029941, partial [Oryza meyeriana var. granulata]
RASLPAKLRPADNFVDVFGIMESSCQRSEVITGTRAGQLGQHVELVGDLLPELELVELMRRGGLALRRCYALVTACLWTRFGMRRTWRSWSAWTHSG